MQAREVLQKLRGALMAAPISIQFPTSPAPGSWQEAAAKAGLVGLVDWLLADLDRMGGAVSSTEGGALESLLSVVVKEIGGKPAPPANGKQVQTPTWQTEAAKGITQFVSFLHTAIGTDPQSDPKKKDGDGMSPASGTRMTGGGSPSSDEPSVSSEDKEGAVILDKDDTADAGPEEPNPPGGAGADEGTGDRKGYLDLADDQL